MAAAADEQEERLQHKISAQEGGVGRVFACSFLPSSSSLRSGERRRTVLQSRVKKTAGRSKDRESRKECGDNDDSLSSFPSRIEGQSVLVVCVTSVPRIPRLTRFFFTHDESPSYAPKSGKTCLFHELMCVRDEIRAEDSVLWDPGEIINLIPFFQENPGKWRRECHGQQE